SVTLPVGAPDAGNIDAAIIEPAHYNPAIGVLYKIGTRTVRFTLDFPELHPPPDTASFKFKHPAKHDHMKTYVDLLRRWLPTVRKEKPVGTILMLPGYGLGKSSLISWGLFFADRGWRVVLIDLRGQGASQSPYLTWGVKDKDDLHRLVELLQRRHILKTPWLYFGISYGGGVALMAASGAPRPDGVIVIAPWANARDVIPRFGRLAGGWMAPARDSPQWAEAEKEAGKLAGIHLSNAVPAQSVPLIQAPVLYLGGTADKIATPAEIESLAKATPNASVKLFPGLPHIVVSMDIPIACHTIISWLAAELHQSSQRPCIIHRKTADSHV
ncbi:alpha/beta hydrolase fold protein, partial [mine drainage metagenome]